MRHSNEKLIKSLGKAVKETRTDLGMTQVQLAKEAELQRKDIDLYEKGLKEPRVSTFLKLHEVFVQRSSSWMWHINQIFRI